MLTLPQVANDLLSKLGIEDAATATALQLQDVVVAINGAMQMLQTAGQDFFTRTIGTISVSAGTANYTINTSFQSVLGPVRWNDTKPLRALTSQGELDQFSRIFYGGAGYGVGSDGVPAAYFVKFLRTGGTTGDIVAVSIRLAPAPATSGTLTFEAENDAPSYTTSDLSSTNELPVAQDYTESIFLPIARMLITRSSQFSRPDLLEQLTTDGTRAMQTLGLAGGFPNATQSEPPREVEA